MNDSAFPTVTARDLRRNYARVELIFALLLALHFGIALGVRALLGALAPAFAANPYAVFFYDSLPFYFVAVPLCAFLARRAVPADPPKKQPLGAARYLSLLFIGVFFLVAGSIVGTLFNNVFEVIRGVRPSEISEIIEGNNLPLSLLFVGVLAPIAEEFIFRKVIIDATRRMGEGTAILLSATVFGLGHGNFGQCFFAFGLGLVFGYIYCRGGRLWMTIVPHAVLNSVSTLLTILVLPKFTEFASRTEELLSLSDEEMLRVTWQYLPAVFTALCYVFAIYGAALLGLIFFCLRVKHVQLAPAALALDRGSYRVVPTTRDTARAAFLNYGAFILLAVIVFYFVRAIV